MGKAPPPVEGGGAEGDHLVEVLKVMIICTQRECVCGERFISVIYTTVIPLGCK